VYGVSKWNEVKEMTKILNIIWHDLIKLSRDRIALLFMILLPVLLTVVMGLIAGTAGSNEELQKIPIAIVNRDGSEITVKLLEELRKEESMLFEELSEEELYAQVRNVGVEAGFILEKGFGEKIKAGEAPEIKVVKVRSSVSYMAVERMINSAISRMKVKEGTKAYFSGKLPVMDASAKEILLSDVEKRMEDDLRSETLVSVETRMYSDGSESGEYDSKAQSSMGMAVMFVMFTLMLGAGEILEEKKNNTWGRLNITPTSKATIILGKTLSTFVRGWAQVLFLMFFGSLVFGVSWGNSFPVTVLLFSVYLLSVTSIGMFLSTIVKTNAQLGAFSSIFIICTSMLSGCYWPVEIMPAGMQQIAAFFPQYWAMKGLTNTVVGNLGQQSVTNHLLILTGVALVFFTLSVIKGRFRVGPVNPVIQQGVSSEDMA
jgi:ABC-2 type transport system permease protein